MDSRFRIVEFPETLVKNTSSYRYKKRVDRLNKIFNVGVIPATKDIKVKGIIVEKRKYSDKVMCKALLLQPHRSRSGRSPKSKLIDFVWVIEASIVITDEITLEEMLTHATASVRNFARKEMGL